MDYSIAIVTGYGPLRAGRSHSPKLGLARATGPQPPGYPSGQGVDPTVVWAEDGAVLSSPKYQETVAVLR